MKFIIKIALSALAVFALSYWLPNVSVDHWKTALLVAIVLGFLNSIIAPILKFLTIPITIVTLGLFLLVINAGMVKLADHFIDGFNVNGWLWALIFSIALSIAQSILNKIFVPSGKKN